MPQAPPPLELHAMHPELAGYLQPRVSRLGYLGEWFKRAAHAPAALLAFMRFTDALKEALPEHLTETAVLTVASLLENQYERNQHERLSVRLGYAHNWIAEVERLDPDGAHLMNEAERAVQRYAIAAVTTSGRRATIEFDAMAALLSSAEAIAVVLLVGRDVTHAIAVNTLRLAAPVPSIFADGFTGDGAPVEDHLQERMLGHKMGAKR